MILRGLRNCVSADSPPDFKKRKQTMSAEGIHQDILRQPESLARVVDHHCGAGCSEMQAAAGLVRDAPVVILTGMGASLFACIPLQYYLGAKGRRVVLLEAAELLHYQPEICRGAVVIVVSRSGDTVEVSKLLDRLEEYGARVIGVTNEVSSGLAGNAGEVLLVASRRDELVAIQSYTGQLLTLMMLGSLACGEPEAEWRSGVDRVVSGLGGVIQCHLECIGAMRSFFANAACIHLLGRGPSLASCCEGALLFNETAKLPAIASPAGQFRHGPVEVVDSSFRGIVFAPAGKTRQLNLQLARDLKSFGGSVCVVGPKGEGVSPDLLCWELPADTCLFTAVFEVVPLQIAAWQVAQWRGLVPGEFRYVSPITLDEGSFPPRRK
jgi:glucosamine--fructose-6-phosphate aminotransferase (isomerizing)